MDDQPQKTNLQTELDQLLADLKKESQTFKSSSRVLIAKANQLADDLDRTDLADIDAAERTAMKDLNAAVAEEMNSLAEAEEDIGAETA